MRCPAALPILEAQHDDWRRRDRRREADTRYGIVCPNVDARTLTTPFDIVVEGETPGDDPARAADIVRPLAEAGVTWWMESVWHTPETLGGVEGMRGRIRQGPPPMP